MCPFQGSLVAEDCIVSYPGWVVLAHTDNHVHVGHQLWDQLRVWLCPHAHKGAKASKPGENVSHLTAMPYFVVVLRVGVLVAWGEPEFW